MVNRIMRNILILILTCCFNITISGQLVYETLLHSEALMKNGETGDAIELLSSVINDKKDSRLYIERAEAFIEEGDYQSAINDCNTANSLVPYSGEYLLARIYAMKGDAGTSLYHLERNIGSPFRKSEKDVMLDTAFGLIEVSPEWRQFWKKDLYSDLETGVSEIEYYLSANMNDEALNRMAEIENQYNDLTSDLSVSAWAYVNNPADDGYQQVVGRDNNNVTAPWYMGYRARYNFFIAGNFGGSWRGAFLQSPEIEKGWHHIVFTHITGEQRLFLDGVEVDNDSYGDIISSSEELKIGANNPLRKFFSGSIDKVMIFDKALTGLEVKDLYNRTLRGDL